jgi:hypothetical protein
MESLFIIISIGAIITIMFYLITSLIIREIGELVIKVPDNTFLKASKVAGVLSGLMFLQFILDFWYFKEIILIIMLILLFIMTHIIYDLDWKEASIMASVCILTYIVILSLISLIIIITI